MSNKVYVIENLQSCEMEVFKEAQKLHDYLVSRQIDLSQIGDSFLSDLEGMSSDVPNILYNEDEVEYSLNVVTTQHVNSIILQKNSSPAAIIARYSIEDYRIASIMKDFLIKKGIEVVSTDMVWRLQFFLSDMFWAFKNDEKVVREQVELHLENPDKWKYRDIFLLSDFDTSLRDLLV